MLIPAKRRNSMLFRESGLVHRWSKQFSRLGRTVVKFMLTRYTSWLHATARSRAHAFMQHYSEYPRYMTGIISRWRIASILESIGAR